ncbi:LPS translocon maturation chaperone LptM [Agrobacterium sp. ES01]|uniref:LPS translocon maturation chaperone LptM n=1 Tax=Agrobacterium sp. ES01 TaxID=3420714 RepID=UPI003D137823
MVKSLKQTLLMTGLMVATLAVLSGCGRKTDLDPPNMPVEQQNKQSTPDQTSAPDRPFVLDPLL